MAQQFDNDPTASCTTTIPDEVKARFKKFKTARDQENNLFQMKINAKTLEVEVEFEETHIPISQVAAELPESQPRFLVYSYKHTHKDNRVSYPLVCIYYCPPGGPTQSNMLYSSTKPKLLKDLVITKVFDIKNAEDLTEEWLVQKLGFFNGM